MITASRPDHAVTRNSSHFKRIPSQTVDNDYTHEVEYAEQEQYELLPEYHAPRVPSDPVPPSRPSREHRCPRHLNDYAM